MLALLGLVSWIVWLIAAVSILVNERYPENLWNFQRSVIRWEARLLAYLAHHRGKVVSRTELVEHLYDQDFDRDSNTIEVFVGRLRKKLSSGLIQTVRCLGYTLEDPALGAKHPA